MSSLFVHVCIYFYLHIVTTSKYAFPGALFSDFRFYLQFGEALKTVLKLFIVDSYILS